MALEFMQRRAFADNGFAFRVCSGLVFGRAFEMVDGRHLFPAACPGTQSEPAGAEPHEAADFHDGPLAPRPRQPAAINAYPSVGSR